MTYDEHTCCQGPWHHLGQQGQHWWHGHVGGIDPTGSHRSCRMAAQSSGCVPALAPGNTAHWGFGDADDGMQEAENSPSVPRDQLVSPRKCHGVLLLLPSLCAVPPQQYGATVKPQCPLQLRAMLQAVRLAVGHLGLCFHIQTAHLPPTCHSSRIYFAVTFWEYQARASWAGVLWPQTVHSSCLHLGSFRHCYPVRSHWQVDPRAEGFPRGSVVWGMT